MFLERMAIQPHVDDLNKYSNHMKSGEKAAIKALITAKTIGSAVVLGLAAFGAMTIALTLCNIDNKNR